ncbi:MAG: BlaI/MecI/CopY family transcriptional regulator [Tepidisphaeraceae bacterium]
MPTGQPVTTDVTDAELAVLERLWATPGATIRDITDKLYPRRGAAHYATVQKLLERLGGKRLIARDAGEIPHKFSASVNRGEFIGRRMRAMADQLCGGSLAPLLTSFVRTQPLKRKEIDELRALIDRLDRSRKSR